MDKRDRFIAEIRDEARADARPGGRSVGPGAADLSGARIAAAQATRQGNRPDDGRGSAGRCREARGAGEAFAAAGIAKSELGRRMAVMPISA